MFAHPKTSEDNVIAQQGADLHVMEPSDAFGQESLMLAPALPGQSGGVMFGQDNGQVPFASMSPFGVTIFGQPGGQVSFAPPSHSATHSPHLSRLVAMSAKFAPARTFAPGTSSLSQFVTAGTVSLATASATTLPAQNLALQELPTAVPAVVVSTSGSGLVFDNTYGSSCTAQFEACIVAAEKQLESLFTNSDTIVVTFNESNEGNNGDALGNSSNGIDCSYATLKAAILKVAPGDVLPSADPSGGADWYVPYSYARMLGLSSTTGSPDLSVTLNSYYPWAFGQDVINGLTHELSEGGLGRIGELGGTGGQGWSTMDLFRYNAAGQADYSNGRDGDTTYFSSNGGASLSDQNLAGKGAPTLSYNNQYNSSGFKVNGGDTADWVQNYVFGSTGDGETLALTQTELDVMEALGWHLSLHEDVDSASGTWETPTDWSTGSMPIEPQDAYISGADVSLDSNVLVNSINTSASSILTIGDSAATKLTAVDGTVLNSQDTAFIASGNLGDILIYTGSALQIGYVNETFFNAGTIGLGKGAGGSGAADLDIAGSINLNGAGTLTLGETGTTGDILDAPGVSADTLINVNNTISGSGLIELGGTFDNQSAGVVEDQSSLRISAGTFTNEGAITDEAKATLDLGTDGATQSLGNTGSVALEAGADLAISGSYTATGSGAIYLKGAGSEITSDGKAATFINASTIEADNSSKIGDANLTFSNSGSVAASLSGVTLSIDTGTHSVVNTGTLVAANSATLAIASNLTNQGIVSAGGISSSETTTGTVDLGLDGATGSATNTGDIDIYGNSDLAISGNYTISGSGDIAFKGAGAAITSDGAALATFTNASTIEAVASGQIGDVGIKSSDDLTFINKGTVLALGSGVTLTLNTGDISINDAGGLLEAESGAILAIDCSVSTGVGGTIEAISGGEVLVNGAIGGTGTLSAANGALVDLTAGGSFGGAFTGTGEVAIAGNTTLTAGAKLLAADVIDSANVTLASVGVTNTLGDVYAITAGASTIVTLGSSGTGKFTNAGTLLANGAGTARIAAPLVDTGTISVTSGSLQILGAFSGTGALSIGSGTNAYITAGGSLTETISGAGTLQLGGAYTLSGADVTVAVLQVHGSDELSGSGTLAGALIDNGTVASAGGTLLVGGQVSAAGTLSAGFGTVLDLAGGGSFAGAISGAGTVAIAGATTLTAGAALSAATIADTANLTLASVALTNNTGDIFYLAPASGSTVKLGSTGTGAFTNAGSLVASGDGTATVSAPFTNSGIVSALSGTLSFLSTVNGAGTLDIGTAGTLSLGLGAASGQVADFLGTHGVLDLANPLDFVGTITGFGGSDQIFLENTTYTTFGYSNNILTVKDGSTTEASLHFTGSSNSFSLATEAHGILITFK